VVNIKHKFWILFFLGFGIAGTVLFFPVNIHNQYTCLYHRFIHRHSQKEAIGSVPSSIFNKRANDNNLEEPGDTSSERLDHDTLTRHYVFSFGLLWWASLLLVGFSFYRFFQWKRQGKILNAN